MISLFIFVPKLSLLNQRGDVREWTPPGWHWEVLPSGTCSLVRNPGDVVDPDLLWWLSRGPGSVRREPASRRWYVGVSGGRTSTSVDICIWWKGSITTAGLFLGGYVSIDPVMVPMLWTRCARDAPRGAGPGRS